MSYRVVLMRLGVSGSLLTRGGTGIVRVIVVGCNAVKPDLTDRSEGPGVRHRFGTTSSSTRTLYGFAIGVRPDPILPEATSSSYCAAVHPSR